MKTLLVPVDFSYPSNQATRYALHLARTMEASVTLLHVHYDPITDSDLPPVGLGTTYVDTTEAVLYNIEIQAQKELAEYARQVRLWMPELTIETMMVRGFPEDEIPATAARLHADLIVMGTRSNANHYKSLLGSMTARVALRSSVPVLVVPEDCTYQPIRHVMYASDFDAADTLAIHHLLDLLRDIPYELYTVYIFQEHGRSYSEADYASLRTALAHHLREVKSAVALHVEATGSRDLISGLDRQMLAHHVDLLVMHTHRRGFLSRLTHPSQTRRMLLHTHTPLLVMQETAGGHAVQPQAVREQDAAPTR
ncbi:MAG: universal stress protein [Bacteroidia bacterium]